MKTISELIMELEKRIKINNIDITKYILNQIYDNNYTNTENKILKLCEQIIAEQKLGIIKKSDYFKGKDDGQFMLACRIKTMITKGEWND